MECKIKTQQGYLLILATILIIIATFVGSLLVYMFLGKAGATQNSLQSAAALYIATSGLEIAKRDITVNKMNCIGINGLAKYTNAAQFGGTFTVTGSANLAATSLSSNIGAADVNLPLVNVANFADDGIVLIGSEFIRYVGISGNILLNAIRGEFGTIAAAHSTGAQVAQNQCLLTATGGVPSLVAPEGKRVVRQSLLGTVGFSFGSSIPAIVSVGNVALSGTPLVINSSVTSSSDNFAGSTIVTAGSIAISGSGGTAVGDGSGGLVTSSDKNTLAGDVVQNYTGITAANLFSSFFSTSKAEVKASADVLINHTITNLTELNGFAGQTIWVNGGIAVSGNDHVTVGTTDSPVILIVDGNISFSGTPSLTVNGILYVIGSIATSGNAGLVGNGQVAAEGGVAMSGKGTISFNSSILSTVGFDNTYTVVNYSGNTTGILQEVFP